MKIKSILLAFIIAPLVILLFVPLPTLGVVILYFADIAYSFVILGFSIYAISKKQIPKIFSRLLLFFTMYTIVISVASVRYLFMFKIQIENIPLISKIAKDVFLSSPIAGYILFSVAAIVTFVPMFRIKYEGEEKLTMNIKMFKAIAKITILLFFISIVGCWAIGFSKLKLSYIESFTFYIPYICSNCLMYLIPTMIAANGIFRLNDINKDSQ